MLEATDFIRGDVNGDGVASMSDVFALYGYIFGYADPEPPACYEALDVTDDGTINIVDPAALIGQIFGTRNEPIPAPFPDPGPDPKAGIADTLTCISYGGGKRIEDEMASVSIVSARVVGAEDATAHLTIALSSTAPTAVLFADIRWPEGLLVQPEDGKGVAIRVDRLPGPHTFSTTTIAGNRLRLFYMVHNNDLDPFPSGGERSVIEVFVCVAPGTRAGEYALDLEHAELVDFASATSVDPVLNSMSLVVKEDVSPTATCTSPTVDHQRWGWPSPSSPVTRFQIENVVAQPGDRVRVPFLIHSTGGVRGFSFSVDFDETRLRLIEIEAVAPLGTEGFRFIEFDNRDVNPGGTGVNEGFLAGAALLGLDIPFELPREQDNIIYDFHFEIADAPGGYSTRLEFVDGAPGP